MAVSYSNGQYCQVVRFATTMFEDISQRYSKENSPTMDSTTTLTICWFVRAMVKLGSAQSIRGVCRWLQSIFGVDFGGWSKAAELFACGR